MNKPRKYDDILEDFEELRRTYPADHILKVMEEMRMVKRMKEIPARLEVVGRRGGGDE